VKRTGPVAVREGVIGAGSTARACAVETGGPRQRRHVAKTASKKTESARVISRAFPSDHVGGERSPGRSPGGALPGPSAGRRPDPPPGAAGRRRGRLHPPRRTASGFPRSRSPPGRLLARTGDALLPLAEGNHRRDPYTEGA
jgi:hypothetical protein